MIFVLELAAEIFSQANKFSLNRLDIEKAAYYTRNGCVSPSLLVLALLYLERLKTCNPKYLTKVSPTELFLISLVSNYFKTVNKKGLKTFNEILSFFLNSGCRIKIFARQWRR